MKQYKGNMKNISKILVSDPSYDKTVYCRYEKNFVKNKNFKIELNIRKVNKLYDKKIRIKGVEFSLLLQNSEIPDITKKFFY